jgi:hypothetical protein
MSRFSRGYLLVSALFTIALAAAVIVAAGYYVNPFLLVGQILGIGLPSYAPFAILALARLKSAWATLPIAGIILFGWARVVYIDTRPYEGGGASFAILVGWAACVLAMVLAVLFAAVRDMRSGAPPRG